MAVRALVAKQLSTAAANGSGSGSVKQGTSAPSTGGIVIKEGGSGSSSGSGKAEGEGMEIDDEEYARLLAAEQDEMERKRGGKGGKGKAGEHFKECVGYGTPRNHAPPPLSMYGAIPNPTRHVLYPATPRVHGAWTVLCGAKESALWKNLFREEPLPRVAAPSINVRCACM